MSCARAIVWMDAKEAHVFHFGADDVEKERIKGAQPLPQGASQGRHFDDIAEALR